MPTNLSLQNFNIKFLDLYSKRAVGSVPADARQILTQSYFALRSMSAATL